MATLMPGTDTHLGNVGLSGLSVETCLDELLLSAGHVPSAA